MRLSLSVALASYNGDEYIAEQLESIARQTRLPDELVVSDDASIDRTPAIVLDFVKRVPFPVRFLKNDERLGSTRNFESAIRACKGNIIFLCDQDDVWYPDKIALIEERFINCPAVGAVFTDATVVDEELRPFGQSLWKTFRFSSEEQARVNACDALGVLLKHPVVTGATMAFRSTYRDLVLPLPDTWHDAWIAMLIGAASCLHALPIPLIAYRQHDTNQLGIPRRGRNRGKTCAAVYEPQVFRYEMARARLLKLIHRFPVSEETMISIDEALVFLRARAALPDARWRRLPRALHELVAHRYHRYAYGLSSFRKDLLR
jgi:glycosyltransferase involved in cell wall biosynthesis